jgi:DnaK suppressor protein
MQSEEEHPAVAKKASTTRDLKDVQAKLRQQLAELQYRLSLVVEQGRESTKGDTSDVADQAVSSYETEILFTRGTHEHAQMRRIQQALLRIDEGDFGICQRCEKEIGEKRLEALPWTPYCIACQEHLEQQSPQERERATA